MLYRNFKEEEMRNLENIKTVEGIPPLTLSRSKGKPLKDYKIYGNSVQNGTPTPDTPIEIESVGDTIIPKEYQEVEYIQSSGTQYIDTGIKANNNTKLHVIFSNNTSDSWYICGTRSSSDVMYFALSGSKFGSTIFSRFNNQGDTVNTDGVNWKRNTSMTNYEVTLETKGTKCDFIIEDFTNDRKFSVIDKNFNSIEVSGNNTNIHLFALNSSNVQVGNTRVKVFEVWQNGNKIAEYIPCYRKSDNEIGMYDLVNNVFYTNAGTGVFTKGNDVNHYKIPVTATNGTETFTTNIYLDEPLRKIGDYADYIDFKNQKVVRNIGYKLFNGTESWKENGANIVIENATSLWGAIARVNGLCSHLLFHVSSTAAGYCRFANDFNIYNYKTAFNITSISEFKNYLETNNIEINYPLANSTEETIELQQILTAKGDCILDVDTKVIPSNMLVKYI